MHGLGYYDAGKELTAPMKEALDRARPDLERASTGAWWLARGQNRPWQRLKRWTEGQRILGVPWSATRKRYK